LVKFRLKGGKMITRRVKLKLSKMQKKHIDSAMVASATLYNNLLSLNFELIDAAEKNLSKIDMINRVRDLKLGMNLGSDIIDQICGRVHKCFKFWLWSESIKLNFWLEHGAEYRRPLAGYLQSKGKKLWGKPRFKKAGKGISLHFAVRKTSQMMIRIKGRYTSITLPKLGSVKGFNDLQALVGNIKMVSINKDACSDYWANIVCDGDLNVIEFAPRAIAIGVDLGLKHTMTAANNNEMIKPESDRFLDAQIKNVQQASKTRKRDLPFIHRKIARRRKHSHHVMAKKLCLAARFIHVGHLNTRFLFAGKLARSASDAAHAEFLAILSRKAENAGAKVFLINEAYTTQTCYRCKRMQKMSLAEREYHCPCGYSNCRDVNAALNILEKGEKQRLEFFIQSPGL
jgi:putative transposase